MSFKINNLITSFLIGIPILSGCNTKIDQHTKVSQDSSSSSSVTVSSSDPLKTRKGSEFKGLNLGSEKELLLEEALNLSPGHFKKTKEFALDRTKFKAVSMDQFGITNSQSDIPINGTYSVGNCIALVIYDPKTTTTAVAHISIRTDVKSLMNNLFDELKDIELSNNPNLTVRLTGGLPGWIASVKISANLLQCLKDKRIKVSNADILDRPHPINFAIDSRTGEITEISYDYSLETNRTIPTSFKEFDYRK